VCPARLLSPCPGPLREPDPIACEELLIDGPGVFVLWDVACHVIPVAMHQVGDGKLLDEPLHGRSLAAVHKLLCRKQEQWDGCLWHHPPRKPSSKSLAASAGSHRTAWLVRKPPRSPPSVFRAPPAPPCGPAWTAKLVLPARRVRAPFLMRGA